MHHPNVIYKLIKYVYKLQIITFLSPSNCSDIKPGAGPEVNKTKKKNRKQQQQKQKQQQQQQQ